MAEEFFGRGLKFIPNLHAVSISELRARGYLQISPISKLKIPIRFLKHVEYGFQAGFMSHSMEEQ